MSPVAQPRPEELCSTVLSKEEEAVAVPFRKHTASARRLPLRLAGDDPASDACIAASSIAILSGPTDLEGDQPSKALPF
jgi:hypothetical protein